MSARNNTRIVAYDDAAIAQAAALVRAGGCVAVPTETVYGLAADATNAAAVAGIYAAKERPAFNPLIVHVASLADAEALAGFDSVARTLAERFWPGPLTLVLPARAGSPIASLATAGLPTVALRNPAHRAMRALIEASGLPLAAPSANASGRISPTTAAHVLASLGGRIPMIIDDGPTTAGIESTVVGVSEGTVRLLRPGPITAEALGVPLALSVATIEAPGQSASHYAPRTPLLLDQMRTDADMWLIGFGRVPGQAMLSARGDLAEAAANLFARLHEADASGCTTIGVAPVPNHGLGAAINDRLRRAAA